jgi:hypothetical protein
VALEHHAGVSTATDGIRILCVVREWNQYLDIRCDIDTFKLLHSPAESASENSPLPPIRFAGSPSTQVALDVERTHRIRSRAQLLNADDAGEPELPGHLPLG